MLSNPRRQFPPPSRHDLAANGSGLQMATVRNLLTAWVLTLPDSIALAGALYWLFNTLFATA